MHLIRDVLGVFYCLAAFQYAVIPIPQNVWFLTEAVIPTWAARRLTISSAVSGVNWICCGWDRQEVLHTMLRGAKVQYRCVEIQRTELYGLPLRGLYDRRIKTEQNTNHS